MTASHTDDLTRGFPEEAFPLRNYDDSGLCDLKNENLFPINKFNMFRGKTPAAQRMYALIEPALLLISRIIIQCAPTFAIFIQRRDAGLEDVFLDTDAELALPDQDIIELVKRYIPEIEFDPDMTPNSSSFAQTTLRPTSALDMITLDYNLVQLLRSPTATHSQKLAGLVFLAVLLGHEMAHVLEFRCIRGGHLRTDDEPFDTPPGITCREAGTAWELRTFGGRIYPICQPENSLFGIRGLCMKSSAWNFDMMKMNERWIRRLFTESYWLDNARHQNHLLRPPIDTFAGYAFLEDELVERQADLCMKRKARKSEVEVDTGSPRKKRFRGYSSPVKLCGGKKVQISAVMI